MTAVPTIRPYATREEWRRDFHNGVALLDEEPPTLDVWDVLDRETGYHVEAVRMDSRAAGFYAEDWPRYTLYNRRTGEVAYGAGVQS